MPQHFFSPPFYNLLWRRVNMNVSVPKYSSALQTYCLICTSSLLKVIKQADLFFLLRMYPRHSWAGWDEDRPQYTLYSLPCPPPVQPVFWHLASGVLVKNIFFKRVIFLDDVWMCYCIQRRRAVIAKTVIAFHVRWPKCCSVCLPRRDRRALVV